MADRLGDMRHCRDYPSDAEPGSMARRVDERQRLLAEGYRLEREEARQQLRGAMGALRELCAASDDLPASGYTPDRIAKETRLIEAWRAVRAIAEGQ